MAETVFSNLRARGTLVIVGATTLATLVATTVTGTVGSFTTSLETPTLSGSTLVLGGGTTTITGDTANGWALGTSGTLTGATLSGQTLYGGGGVQLLNSDGTRFTTMEATTVSGATIRTTAGTFIINNTSYPGLYLQGTATGNVLHAEKWLTSSGSLKVVSTATIQGTLSGTTIRAASFTGSALYIGKMGAGSGKITVHGGAGSFICLFDSDAGGYSKIVSLNGTVSATVAGPGDCP